MKPEARIQMIIRKLNWTLFLIIINHLNAGSVIDLTDRDDVRGRSPILIAHRGGVVSEDASECSLTAIIRASERGYDMVELDVQESRDGVPVVFHDRTLEKACGRSGRVRDFDSSKLIGIHYLNSSDRILTLEKALAICHEKNLGVMLDFKSGHENEVFLKQIDQLILKQQLQKSTITITGSEKVRSILKQVMFTPRFEEMRKLREGHRIQLKERFWFGLPKQLMPGDVKKLKQAQVLILPAINTFRYPADGHLESAARDIQRLIEEGVDGFQIDSIYDSNFAKVAQAASEPN